MAATEDISVEAERWVASYGDLLYRHARVRVRDGSLAEDLVQDTLLAAWKARKKQRPVRSERAWLMGILRNKIADHYRRFSREEAAMDPEMMAEVEATQFSDGGWCGPHWLNKTGPRGWWNPSASLQQREFYRVLHDCTAHLPEQAARVFLMRELDEHPTEEICSALGITSNHLFVLLHRARLALRRCLEFNWFGNKKRRAAPS